MTHCKANGNLNNCIAVGDWQQGRVVFSDANADASVDDGEEILLVTITGRGSVVKASDTGQGACL